MRSRVTALLIASFLVTCGASAAAWLVNANTANAAVPPQASRHDVPDGENNFTEFPPDQEVYSDYGEVAYVVAYGHFSDLGWGSIEIASAPFLYSSDLYYWDEEMVVIRVVSLGPTRGTGLKAKTRDPADVDITVKIGPDVTKPIASLPNGAVPKVTVKVFPGPST
jgi:hypothetical protein